MYLYVMLALFLGLTFMEVVGLPWPALSQVPPLDLLHRVPGGAAVADLVVLFALYGLAWIVATAVLQMWSTFTATDDAPTRGQSLEGLIAAGHSRAGLEIYLWTGVTAVPAIALGILIANGFNHRGVEALFIGGGVALAAAQALHPFRWQEDFFPGLRRLFSGAVAQGETPSQAPAAGQTDPLLAAGMQAESTHAHMGPVHWGRGWWELFPPTQVPDQLVDATMDELSQELETAALHYGAAFPLGPEQRRLVAGDLRSMLRDGYAAAVGWGFVSQTPIGGDAANGHTILAMSIYRLTDGLPPVSHPEPMTVVPRWGDGSVRFRIWFEPSPLLLKLSPAERGDWRRSLHCPGQAELDELLVPARPLQTVHWWWCRGSQYLAKEMFDVNAF